jgi:N-acetylglucosamine kinase-like BadF-type ATPase
MLLIADSGSSKTDWRLFETKGTIFPFHTEGLNPYYKTIEEIIAVLKNALIPDLPCKVEEVTHIYFYGAGCSVAAKCEEVKKALSDCFPATKVSVEHDILGAARACCGYEKGIVCILGTGSNSCLYDGNNITETIGGLGYILGDEGRGCHIGKTIVAAYLNHELPEELKTDFYYTYHLDRAAIDKKVYQQPNANRFLASFSMFAGKHKTHSFIQSILKNCFELYLDKHVCRYSDFTNTTVSFVGSVAFYNKDLINELCSNKGIKTGKFLKEPVEELVKFHKVS